MLPRPIVIAVAVRQGSGQHEKICAPREPCTAFHQHGPSGPSVSQGQIARHPPSCQCRRCLLSILSVKLPELGRHVSFSDGIVRPIDWSFAPHVPCARERKSRCRVLIDQRRNGRRRLKGALWRVAIAAAEPDDDGEGAGQPRQRRRREPSPPSWCVPGRTATHLDESTVEGVGQGESTGILKELSRGHDSLGVGRQAFGAALHVMGALRVDLATSPLGQQGQLLKRQVTVSRHAPLPSGETDVGVGDGSAPES